MKQEQLMFEDEEVYMPVKVGVHKGFRSFAQQEEEDTGIRVVVEEEGREQEQFDVVVEKEGEQLELIQEELKEHITHTSSSEDPRD